MSDREELEGLIAELVRMLERSVASSIEVETNAFSVKVVRGGAPAVERRERAGASEAAAEPEKVQRVRATTVGIFSTSREWRPGDQVERGTVLGAVQSLGHMADITAPADGTIEQVLAASGAPVEYGQPLFAIALA